MTDRHRFDPTVLREYDIRGVVGRTLSAAVTMNGSRRRAQLLRFAVTASQRLRRLVDPGV